MSTAVDGTSTYGVAAKTASSWLSQGQEVSTDDFLKLLTLQLKYQNPLEPMKETEFVTQLAQFSQLEAERGIHALTARLVETQMLSQAAELLGRTVLLRPPDSDEFVQGVVEKVKVVDGMPRLVVGGQEYPLSDVAEVVK
ncbi:flagellar hook capping FlgD N-terminal domain-containing protein [Carboxydochorda subterranea]|uniref:Flagellar hook capping FlgD N-terminal domain-containing protein n=1 Tax=Carboxydichorda subterranea TaxID=3109565 RepID=A0ABZ1C0N9_9FIRM|nr:flagellar hook capping FlgD N-terminal domain-containing protein [Limnochorda sp. L945t]WRP18453.1 flagellar hook capping FlgD N-terminal domain-containing protein [Limnochorda sp. L945t]